MPPVRCVIGLKWNLLVDTECNFMADSSYSGVVGFAYIKTEGGCEARDAVQLLSPLLRIR